ncbi:inosine/xanthosine triphosphatase [Shewanella baltica]|uniref:inosine/xanthosine triphosphatase n=1 Tax=Shewanella baltica TaxID=62322 RepID=UPI00217F20F0|nr:inosine/xanthosine triphosphatase [Shewanella baltica]MCS6205097.1 non-canonical purine NTP phosphatase [Shewanella baltica]
MQQNIIKIKVGSKNPVKINAATKAMAQLFPDSIIEASGMDAPSGVAAQPMTDKDTRQGAINRVHYCQQQDLQDTQADYYFAMEGGVDCFDFGPATFAYIAIGHKDQLAIGRSAILPLPMQVYRALEAGEELGHVMDRLFNTVNIKQKGGAIGLLTHGHATRESNYTQAIILAMAPLLNPDIYVQNC